ncbi:hypothetical protein K9N08_04555 [Candidatus Gracilibacteria bacterium]|nr:hypothetical protein [Candidatus Gracilibacteria bacterium]
MLKKFLLPVILFVALVAGFYFWQKSPTEKFPDWIEATYPELQISFRHPIDTTISLPEVRETNNGTMVNELIVTPAGVDATRVHFFTTNVSPEEAKNIKIYESLKLERSEFKSASIDGVSGMRRIDYLLHNDCTNELTVVQHEGKIFGINLVQCPTHPAGYDAIRREIADSVKLISFGK